MDEFSVRFEHEGGRLHVSAAVVRARVAADRRRGGCRVETREHLVAKALFDDGAACLVGSVRRDGDDAGAEILECGVVLFEVSQLLTTVPSPVTAVEDHHRGMSLHDIGNTNVLPVVCARGQAGEALSGL